jgi:hypothetical protein
LRPNNPIASLLFDVLFVFVASGQDRMFSRDLVDCLNHEFKERPWMQLPGLRPSEKGPGVADYWLARQLRTYGIRSKTLRLKGVLGKGYVKEDMDEVFHRYVPQTEVDAAMADLAARTVAEDGIGEASGTE